MLTSLKIIPTIPAADLQRAKMFYKEKLGLSPKSETPDGVMYECGGGTGFTLYATPNAGKNPATYAGWNTTDIESEVAELKKQGVVFEEYDMPGAGIKTVNSIATLGSEKAAWFKDSEGNILGIFQE